MQEYYKNTVDKLKFSKSTILSVVFVILGLILTAFISAGFEFNLSFYNDPKFWGKTITSYLIMMSTYVIVKKTTIEREKRDSNNDFFKSKKRYDNYIKIVRNKHLERVIELAVERENERRRIEACQNKLNKVTYNLRYEELDKFTEKEFEEYCIKYKLSKREKKKLHKAIKAAMNSKVRYKKIRAYDILVYSEKTKDSEYEEYAVYISSLAFKDTLKKTISFIVSTTIANALVWHGVGHEFWLFLLTNAVLIIGSVISAMFSASMRVNYLRQILDNRCGFLNVALADELKSNNHQLDL